MSGAAQKSQGAKPKVHKDNLQPSTKTTNSSSNADNATASASDGDGAENRAEASGGGSERSAGSPEPNCAICLGALENKSFTDSCFHMFCFVCLQEWSKVKPECPLCKQPFKSIIHNVKSYNNYDQFYLDHHPPAPPAMRIGWNFDRSFRYRTTLTMDHRYILPPTLPHYRPLSPDTAMHRSLLYPSQLPRYYRSRRLRSMRTESVSTTNFRRGIYLTGRRVTGLRSSQRRRTVTPDFFRSNPAQTHRLVPWLNRELNALLYSTETQVTFVLELIMDLIKRFPIDSDEFYEHIHPYLHENTRHFMHEFLSFARSPYTMRTYDTKAVYEETPQVPLSHSDFSSSNLDVVVVDDDDVDVVGRPVQVGAVAAAAGPSDQQWRTPELPGNVLAERRLRGIFCSSNIGQSGWDSPTPGPSWDMGGAMSQSPVSIDDSSDSEASTIIDPTYVAQDTPNSRPPRSRSPDESDGEDVIFVSYDKPWEERSPIQLSSGSDDEALSKFAKRLKREHKKKKVRAAATSPSASHHSRSRHRERSLTPPGPYSSRSPHARSSHHHDQPSSSSSRSRQRHQRKRHHEALEEQPHSSSSRLSRKEKHGHSTLATHSESSHKKHRRQDRLDEDSAYMSSDSRRKKHKHKKKHKKNKDKSSKSSKKRDADGDGHAGGSSRKSSDRTSSRSREDGDRCKKHPSGHKKSRARESGEGGHSQREAREGSSGHHSDALLSDTSTSSSSSTSTITSTTEREPLSAGFSTRQQRVQQVLQERCQANNSLSMPVFPGMDVSASWDSITRLARLLASQAASSFPPSSRPGPSHFPSSSEPVVISTSSDESDQEAPCRRPGNGGVTGDNMSVAKTVVVPCSSRMGVPTPAIDFNVAPSTSTSRPLIIDECIDVESISSDDESVVDVESLDDTEDSCTEPTSSSSACEMGAGISRSVDVTEVSAEVVPSPVTLASLRTHTSAVPAHPFSIQSILNRDVFMGAEPSLSRQASTSSNLDAMVSSQDSLFSHSQPQLTEGLRNAGSEHSRPLQPGYVSKLDQLLPQRLLSQPSQDNGYQLEGLSLRSLFPQQSMESKESMADSAEHNKESQLSTQLLSPQSSRVSQVDDSLTDSDEELDVTFLETASDRSEGAKPAAVEMSEAHDNSERTDREDGSSHHSTGQDETAAESASTFSSKNAAKVTPTENSEVAESVDSAMGASLMEQDGEDEATWEEVAVTVPQNSGVASIDSTVAAGVSTKASSLSPSSSMSDFPSASGQEMDTSTVDAGDLNTPAGDAISVGGGALCESEFSSQDISEADTSFEKESLAERTTTNEAGDASTSVKDFVASSSIKDFVEDGEGELLSTEAESLSLNAKLVVDAAKTTVGYAYSSAGDMFGEGVESLLADAGSEAEKGQADLCVQSSKNSSSEAKLDTEVGQDCGHDKDTLIPSSDILDSAHLNTDLDDAAKNPTCLGMQTDSISQDGQSDFGSSSADLDLGQSLGDLESEGDLDTDRCLSPLSSSQNDSTILSS